MKCSGCGAEVENDITQCPRCGAPLDGSQPTREITAKLEPRALEEEWRKKAPEPLKALAIIKMGARTDLGRVRENNEDKFDFFEPEDEETLTARGSFYTVADGMGGHAAGQIASEMALRSIVESYYADLLGDPDEALTRSVQQANSLIYDTARAIVERSGMGTTLTGAVVRGDELHVIQVGDSRAYLVRDGAIRQITHDHSWVSEQVRLGALTEEEAQSSPFRNVITRSLGAAPGVEPDIYTERLQKGDIIVLCSDGLSGNVSDEEILRTVDGVSPSLAARRLVDLANERGGSDNITVLVLQVKDIESKGKGSSRLKRLFGGE
ncbi:MAG: Stp1/IreP family PP2C-type Ser/Thr phosphatase [Armatimonadota bacterium]|nr:Stp1/IreP family PP2C-type Ser/Thr phosphatase [Armatimonadota bacterium]